MQSVMDGMRKRGEIKALGNTVINFFEVESTTVGAGSVYIHEKGFPDRLSLVETKWERIPR